jgi:hypothetical protein
MIAKPNLFNPNHLLEQARHLATKEPKKPRQASLRRAVSTAYYALFHLMVRDASKALSMDPLIRPVLHRAFGHEEMKKACATFASGGDLPRLLQDIYPSLSVPRKIADVARAFIDLQKARHDADYAAHGDWTRRMALLEIDRAAQAFKNWEGIRPRGSKGAKIAGLSQGDLEAGRIFLAWLLFRNKLQGH